MNTCTIDGCDKPHLARGWCSQHYSQWRRGSGDNGRQVTTPEQACEVDGCERVFTVRGMCNMHYQRWLKHGDTQTVYVGGIKASRMAAGIIATGQTLDGWLRGERNCTDAQIARITARRWQYGSYRPSVLIDGIEPPYAPLRWHEGVDDAVAA